MNGSVSRHLHQLKLCAKTPTPSTAKALHAQLIKTALNNHPPLPNTLLNLYSKCRLTHDALQLFDEMPHRDHITWTSLLSSLNHSHLPHLSLSFFQSSSLAPDHFIFATLANACAALRALRIGQQVHARFTLSHFYDDDVVKSALVDMYAKCGRADYARAVFESSGERSVVAWTALVSGYARSGRRREALEMFGRMPGKKGLFSWTALISGMAQSGNGGEALRLFVEMRREGVDVVDPLVLSSVVGACANLAVLEVGRQVHGVVVRLGYGLCLFVGNALVDMYAKCSDVLAARVVFGGMQQKDVVSWTSMLVGTAQHGRAEEALALYDEMVGCGVKPNEVTFVGLIYACSHVGFVSKGRAIFRSMVEDYGIRPCLQHYTCFLDLLSRSGHLAEALDLIGSMPFEPDEPTWAALHSACKHHRDIQMGIRVADHLLSLNPEDPASYILLSNAYASAGMWENAAKVRKLMTEREVKKNPGFSSIDIGKESRVFYAGETSHPMKDEIFGLLNELDAEMRKRGYCPDSSFVLHDMEQQEKERQLFWHSERLALAYGLLKAVPGTPIRIVKNLRVCGDCHTVLKFISSIVKRDIIVRDATRYHHFSKGECSCNDFW